MSQGTLMVIQYFTRLRELWDELSTYQATSFKCECKCGAAKGVATIFKQEKVHPLLMGIVTHMYNTIRSVILALEPSPNLNKLYATVVKEGRQLQYT